MTDLLRIVLPVYFITYFSVTFIVKTMTVYVKTGKNPVVLPNDDSVYGLIGFYFRLTLIAVFLYTLAYAFFPAWHDLLLPFTTNVPSVIVFSGLLLLATALIWTIVAQQQMKESWRIGIDKTIRTELITQGLFSLSRNPIFFGMILSLAGLFLVTPNALTGLFLILGYILIQIQVRFEEDFLVMTHGDLYLKYKQKTKRFL